MSHKFSTSLVLNSLAASPPARLHDYETSPLDRVLDPDLLPILELHRGFVREFYSGTIWTRRDLLREHGGLGAWLAGFSEEKKARLRVDVYDVPQFYLTMSILREHGIRVFHWHFIPAVLSLTEAARCPPGMAAKDCPGGGGEDPRAAAPARAGRPRLGRPRGPRDAAVRTTGRRRAWRGRRGRSARSVAPESTGSNPGPMPGGVVPGMTGQTGERFGGQGGRLGFVLARRAGVLEEWPRRARRGAVERAENPGRRVQHAGCSPARNRPAEVGDSVGSRDPDPDSAATLGSFPGARDGRGGAFRRRGPRALAAGRGWPRRQRTAAADRERPRRRRAAVQPSHRPAGVDPAPGAVRRRGRGRAGGDVRDHPPLPRGAAGHAGRRGHAEPADRRLRRADTACVSRAAADLGCGAGRRARPRPQVRPPPPPRVARLPAGPAGDPPRPSRAAGGRGARLRAQSPERRDGRVSRRRRAGRRRGGARSARSRPGGARAQRVSRHLEGPGDPDRALVRAAHAPRCPGARADALARGRLHHARGSTTVIVGFVFADLDAEGRLRVQADANRVRLQGRALFSEYRESTFGSRGWLVSLYAALAAGLALLGVGWRYLAVRTA